MPKFPWMQFNTGDWLKDPKLSMCLPATRGIWADAIAAMHEDNRSGVLAGTPDQLIRVLRCTESDLMSAIDDLKATGAADVTVRNGRITLINRRMQREAKDRELNALRQQRFRESSVCNGKNNGAVTQMSHPKGSLSLSSDSLFDIFYKEYPRKENPKKAREAFKKAGITEDQLQTLLNWVAEAKDSEQWQDKSKIPHPATWLNQQRWLGDPPPRKQDLLPIRKLHPDTIGQSSLTETEIERTPEYEELRRKRAAAFDLEESA